MGTGVVCNVQQAKHTASPTLCRAKDDSFKWSGWRSGVAQSVLKGDGGEGRAGAFPAA